MPKHLLHGPVIFGLIGAAGGVILGLIHHYDVANNQTDATKTFPLVFLGLIAGGFLGSLVALCHLRVPLLQKTIELMGSTLLVGGLGGIGGWFVGDKGTSNPPNEMFAGLLTGVTIGVCVWSVNLWSEKKRTEE